MSTVDFRCEQCGKLLSVEAQEGQTVKCPHCEKKVTVPAGLASLPRPQVPGQAPPPPPPPLPGEAPEQLQEEFVEDTGMSKTMTAVMPWVLSLFLHLGVGLIAGFLGYVAVHKPPIVKSEPPYVPGEEFSDEPGGVVNPGDPGTASEARQNVKQTQVTGYSHHDSEVTGSVGDTGQQAGIISAAGGGGQAGGGWAQFGVGSGGSGHGPKSAFAGSGGNAHHVIFCIDASGSMAFSGRGEGSIFDVVRGKMQQSISRLREVQDFHIVFFQEGTPLEMDSRQLVPATPGNRAAAVRFMNGQTARGGGGTDPVPALSRCFDVMARADNTRKGKQIFLLTDGAFRDNDAVLRCIKDRNKAKDVHIFTFLYGQQDDENIIKLMKDIAQLTGGKYKNIME